MSYTYRTRRLVATVIPNLRADKIPPEACGRWIVDGRMIHVLSREQARARGLTLRVLVACPHCGKEVAESRLHQHVRVHGIVMVNDWR